MVLCRRHDYYDTALERCRHCSLCAANAPDAGLYSDPQVCRVCRQYYNSQQTTPSALVANVSRRERIPAADQAHKASNISAAAWMLMIGSAFLITVVAVEIVIWCCNTICRVKPKPDTPATMDVIESGTSTELFSFLVSDQVTEQVPETAVTHDRNFEDLAFTPSLLGDTSSSQSDAHITTVAEINIADVPSIEELPTAPSVRSATYQSSVTSAIRMTMPSPQADITSTVCMSSTESYSL